MSAPLVLTATELRHLADGLDAMSKARRDYRVGPNEQSPAVTLDAHVGMITLGITWSTDEYPSQYVIDDRYGS